MAEINIQDDFLKKVKNERTPVTVFLFNKVQLHGIITGFDKFIVMLESSGRQQMVFKHSVTTITPSVPVGNLRRPGAPTGGHAGGGAPGSPDSQEDE